MIIGAAAFLLTMRQHCVIIVTKINRVDLCCETAVKGSMAQKPKQTRSLQSTTTTTTTTPITTTTTESTTSETVTSLTESTETTATTSEMTPTEPEYLLGDINGDKKITVEDAQMILLYYVSNTLSGETVAWDDLLSPKSQPVPRKLPKDLWTDLDK